MDITRVQCMLILVMGIVECTDNGLIGQSGPGVREKTTKNKTIIIDSGDVSDRKNNTYSVQAGTEGTVKNNATSVTERQMSPTPDSPEEGLPVTILVASPAVAVGIIIFICVAYKWHTKQLDDQAKELAIQLAAGIDDSSSPCLPCSPSGSAQRPLPTVQSSGLRVLCHSESDLQGPRRKSLRTPSPTSQILLSPAMGIGDKRGSSWSALSDQEIISHSPRRHSTFLL